MTYPRLVSFLLAAVAAACADRAPTAPVADFDARISAAAGARTITVMTQNLYVGADVDLVIGALASTDPTDDIPALLFAIETLGKTDFPARAEAIVDEIARVRPHAVGLQEVSVIDINLPPLGVFIHLDFLTILQAELAARGLNYTMAAQVQNTNAAPLPGISLVDFDVLLVDAGRVAITSAGGENFAVNVSPPPVAPGVELKRGWVWARVEIARQRYTIVSTHAEADLAGAHLSELRAAQLSQLVGTITSPERVIIMGDLNDTPGSPMYQVLAGAGFTDMWAALRPGVVGLTCCHLADLSDQVAAFYQRIDYVFTRGPGLGWHRQNLAGQIDQFGDVPADRVPGAAYLIWPSDHAGLVATLEVGQGLR
jgi:endonuclease/exonuclease/phosphatase family metal-dependent hydrolase